MGDKRTTVGLIGARGYAGRELAALILEHPHFELAYLGSRQHAGRRVDELVPNAPPQLEFEALDLNAIRERPVDVGVLALPNGLAEPYVEALTHAMPEVVIVDLSADYRFDPEWHYGLPELTRTRRGGNRRIANPGCYATGMQLAIAPILDRLASPPVCFGVSGYSGAGTKSSPRNDPRVLEHNLLPYQLVGHMHEREVSHQLGRPVHFTPHVAEFFRGISLTIDLALVEPVDADDVPTHYREWYHDEPLIEIVDDVPQVKDIAGRHGVAIGGFSIGHSGSDSGCRLVLVATLDNLLKGAATQALQNMNLACRFGEFEGIEI